MEKKFDLIVIGSGPAGTRAAIQAAKIGKKVLLIEKDKIGGGCTHTGTIPSKSMREVALQKKQEKFSQSLSRMRNVLTKEEKVLTHQLARNNIETIQATASFIDKTTVLATKGKKQEKYTAAFFVIAPGTKPIRSLDFPFQYSNVHDSDTILSLKKLPKNLLIIGAGVIGCEYASIFTRLGSKVTLVDRRKELLRSVDFEVVEALQKVFESQKIKMIFGCEIGEVKKLSGSTNLKVSLNKRSYTFDTILVCMGREPNISDLNLEVLELKKDARGAIIVNRDNFQTDVPNIYAAGDVIGAPALAATSAEQGRIAACDMFGIEHPKFPNSFPYGIYTIPEISSVGAQEYELREKNIPYVVGRAKFSEVAKGLISGESEGFIKLLVHAESSKVLGVHIIGAASCELVHIGQILLVQSIPISYLVDNVFNYPTYAEAYKIAALNALNQIKHWKTQK